MKLVARQDFASAKPQEFCLAFFGSIYSPIECDVKFEKIDDYEAEGLLSTLTREFGLFSCKKCGAMVMLPSQYLREVTSLDTVLSNMYAQEQFANDTNRPENDKDNFEF